MRKTPRTTRVLAGVLAAVAAVGTAIVMLSGGDHGVAVPDPVAAVAAPTPAPAPAPGADPFREYFESGVEYMRQGRAHEALVSFNAASHLRPHVPEVFVNIGFAHEALGNHQNAAEAFDRALEINPSQANAYYGLAMALEGMERMEEALGAMRTFEHLLPKDEQKFRRLASGAIWEWESALRAKREEARTPPPATPPEPAPPEPAAPKEGN
ncbi:tetratricopeptide repeat protein [Azospirillum sp. sgz301742]